MDKIVGVIYLSSSNPRVAFSTGDLELITAIGIQTGMALNSMSIATEQRKMFTAIISTLVNAVEMRDPALRGRSARVSRFARAMAKALELPATDVNSVALAALLHNIGRLSISEADIILSRSATKREETLEYKQAMRSEELLMNITGLREILPAVKHSFEKFDGSGYPDGLKGEGIPLHARIIAAAHAFDEILQGSPGDKPSTKEALFKLNSLSQEGHIDADLVKALAIAYRMGLLDTGD
jgi:HD-GYP domain-containing protein (c-di-GMP phosphodiesterase class II)